MYYQYFPLSPSITIQSILSLLWAHSTLKVVPGERQNSTAENKEVTMLDRICEKTQHLYFCNPIGILVKYSNHSLVLGGDFNSLDCSALENVFHLTNIVKFPTRENSFLDKIYTNDMSYINANVQKCAPLGKADHACVLVHDVILKKSSIELYTNEL